MPIFGDHSYTSITIKVNQLVQHKNDEIEDVMELYLSDLLHLIKIQPNSGATEAARAIRKKIKYGDTIEEQKRALQLLELLVMNSGKKIGTIIARDDKLLDVLKGIINGHGKTGLGSNYDPKIQKLVIHMSIGWKTEFQDLEGYKYLQGLYKYIPKRIRKDSSSNTRTARGNSNDDEFDDYIDDETDPYSDENIYDEPESKTPRSPAPGSSARSPRLKSPKVPPPRPTTASPYSSQSKDKKEKSKKKSKKRKSKSGIIYADEEYAIPQINYKLESPKIEKLISECNNTTITLNNQLLHLPIHEKPQDSSEILKNFNHCKKIRRKVLKYLQFVGAGNVEDKTPEILQKDEEFLSRLIFANEQLIETFKKFDSKSGYTDENPAPPIHSSALVNADDDREWSDSDESYYDSEDEEEEDLEEPEEDSISSRLQSVTMDKKRAPPPPPPTQSSKTYEKQPTLKNGFDDSSSSRPGLSKTETSDSVLSSNPFGDKNEVTKQDSKYY
ncbi:uncharacterized protein KGF55_001567 [Candida pseudojiufengensis]|uniref:uncharacterized protein n=1 Tax=Candida pseudojiufengensis TaxID=497109 RepID=UPI0022240DD2|nr:uncharacterized protein KGF55_001567 [Candida pseudojiufengensis]KAI5965346.1 hypothetical protein KGF55_001567 [Candida pseudojiufengensis]